MTALYQQTDETRLLTEVLAEYNAQAAAPLTVSDLNWWIVKDANKQPRAVFVYRMVSGKRVGVKTVSRKDVSAWLAWQPVIANVLAQHANGKKSVSHKGMEIPQ